MKIETKSYIRRNSTNDLCRIVVNLTVDGMDCGDTVIASGARVKDAEALLAGTITMQELADIMFGAHKKVGREEL